MKQPRPEAKGFFEPNLRHMNQFQRAYPYLLENPQRPVSELPEESRAGIIWPQPVAKFETKDSIPLAQGSGETPIGQQAVADIHAFVRALSWTVNILLIHKVKDLEIRKWYMRAYIEQGWGRSVLAVMIKPRAHKRQGAVVTNFDTRLPEPHAQFAQDTLKDPYIFDFLTLDKPFRERELEAGLVRHLERFLLELGAGFAFVGRQVHLDKREINASNKDNEALMERIARMNVPLAVIGGQSILEKIYDIAKGELLRYLNIENRLIIQGVEYLWGKYTVSSRKLEAEKETTLKKLDGLMIGLRCLYA
jgi:predicted nuclease of restriction endonuclease-like (RecB) superfamily